MSDALNPLTVDAGGGGVTRPTDHRGRPVVAWATCPGCGRWGALIAAAPHGRGCSHCVDHRRRLVIVDGLAPEVW